MIITYHIINLHGQLGGGLDGSWTTSLAKLVAMNKMGVATINCNNGSCEIDHELP